MSPLNLSGSTGISGVDGSAGTPAVQGTDTNTGISFPAADTIAFNEGGAEVGRFDSSGRLLVGTSTSIGVGSADASLVQVAATNARQAWTSTEVGNQGARLYLGKSRGGSYGSYAVVANNDEVGTIYFAADDGTDLQSLSASIGCAIDGTPGSNDVPGRLVFSTTADSASSPTERLRIGNAGHTWFNSSDFTTLYPGEGNTATGFFVEANGKVAISRDNTNPLVLNRKTSDGTIVDIRQDGTSEGSISVSGTTVSYNGAHLSRWSQLPSGQERTEILRGSVLSNLDEMCEWGDEDNEQLNRMKVSDVEGDKNVSGVFQAWDDDDDTYTNDFYCAMTGDFIIRIGAGTTVERGDLLMSAGDGTAKPQGDGYVQDKTIAKVTSTNVSCTYDDGSYCVPCVLMAC